MEREGMGHIWFGSSLVSEGRSPLGPGYLLLFSRRSAIAGRGRQESVWDPLSSFEGSFDIISGEVTDDCNILSVAPAPMTAVEARELPTAWFDRTSRHGGAVGRSGIEMTKVR